MYKGKLKKIKVPNSTKARTLLYSYQKINKQKSKYNEAEQWAEIEINKFKEDYKKQYLKNYRIFDFYFPKYGVILEIDGGYHTNPKQYSKDMYRDEQYYRAEGLITFRVENFNEDQLLFIKNLFKYKLIESLKDRFHRLQLETYSDLIDRFQDESKSYLEEELNRLKDLLNKAIEDKPYHQATIKPYLPKLKKKKQQKTTKQLSNKTKLKDDTLEVRKLIKSTDTIEPIEITIDFEIIKQEHEKRQKLKSLTDKTKKINIKK